MNSDALVLFGVTGDLAHKKIFPALYAMAKRGALRVPVVGVASSDLSVEQLRARAEEGVRQTANVLATIDRVRKLGVGVIFITHNVRHAMAVGNRFTVLNRGKTLGTAVRGDITAEQLQELMAGGQELATLEGSLGGTV